MQRGIENHTSHVSYMRCTWKVPLMTFVINNLFPIYESWFYKPISGFVFDTFSSIRRLFPRLEMFVFLKDSSRIIIFFIDIAVVARARIVTHAQFRDYPQRLRRSLPISFSKLETSSSVEFAMSRRQPVFFIGR